MNTISLTRVESTDAGVFGKVTLDWDGAEFVSLERMVVEIPVGTYKLVWHVSHHLGGATVPMLIDVPNHSYILLHWGNTQTCSDGCVLIGTQRDGNAIDSTRDACNTLFALIGTVGIENVVIDIK
jgi:Family of unknown function (DUF5675)